MSCVSLGRQIAAMQAEILVRKAELRRERTPESQVAYAIESLEGVVDTLRWLEANESHIKQRLWNGNTPSGEA